MSAFPLLALGALAWLLGSKKKSEPVISVVEKPAPLKPLPVFTADEVFSRADKAAEAENIVPPLEQWGPVPTPSQPQMVVTPPPELGESQDDVVVQSPVPVTPGQAAQAAADNPGLPVEEVMLADPVAAARELAAYVSENRGKGAKLGTKGKPSATVQALQMQMGAIDADGIYGPATRSRGQSLGVSMPPRA